MIPELLFIGNLIVIMVSAFFCGYFHAKRGFLKTIRKELDALVPGQSDFSSKLDLIGRLMESI